MSFICRFYLFVFAAAISFGLPATSLAAPRVALVIGNAEYSEAAARLPNPANDAKDIANSLTALGFDVTLRTDASLDDMKRAVKDFSAKITNAEIAVFFYAGHALQFQSNNYLLPVNAALGSERDALLDGFDVGNVIYLMGSSRAKKIIILDACRDNPFKDKFRTSNVGLAQVSAPPDSLIAYSTAPGAVAYDGTGRNSLYTKHLVNYLKEPNLSILNLFSRVGEAVQKDTQTFKKPQIPFLLSSLTGQLTLGKNDASAAPSVAAASQSQGPSEDSKMNSERVFWESLDKSQSAELQLYLSRFPNGLYSEIAHARLTRLQTSSPEPSRATEVAKNNVSVAVASENSVTNQPRSMAAAALATTTKPVTESTPTATNTVQSIAQPPVNTGPTSLTAPPLSNSAKGIRYSDGSVYEGAITVGGTNTNGVPNGIGTFKGRDGYSYTGAYVLGKRQGQGIQTLGNGDVFEGEFVDDNPNGKGILRLASGDTYEGQMVRGQIEGVGVYKFKSGNMFSGTFVNAQPNGKGVFTYSSGDVYEGQIVAGVINGSGKLRFANRNVYEGEFKNGAPFGKGIWTFNDGTIVDAAQNPQTGKYEGLIKFPSGDTFKGEITGGRADGRGTMAFKNGQKYTGVFTEGRPGGFGVFSFVNGDRFEGEFTGGLENAKGELISATGTRQKAEIVNGQTRTSP
jgi:uncharacterized caspase-like protein